MNSNLCCFE